MASIVFSAGLGSTTAVFNNLLYVGSSEIITCAFLNSSSALATPTSTTVNVYDPYYQLMQVSDSSTISNPSTGVIVFTILPTTLYTNGVFNATWTCIMPDTSQIQFNIPFIVDSNIR